MGEYKAPRIPGSEIVGRGIQLEREYRLVVYDFKRPDKFSKDQIRTISIIHESFARYLSTSISGMLREDAKIHVALVDQCTYEEYLRELPNPAVIGVIELPQLKGMCIFGHPNEMGMAIVERLFGSPTHKEIPQRELTSIEKGVIDGFIARNLDGFREAWSPIIDVSPKMGRIETNKRFVQVAPPTEMVVYVGLECKIGSIETTFTIAYPFTTLEPVIRKLSALHYYGYSRSTSGNRRSIKFPVDELISELEVAVDGPDLTILEIDKLKPGDLIPLEGVDNSEGFLLLNGTPIGRCGWSDPESAVSGKFTLEKPVAPTASKHHEEEAPDLGSQIENLADAITSRIDEGYVRIAANLERIAVHQEDLTDQLAYGENTESETIASSVPFSYIDSEDAEAFVALFGNELPQTIALIVSYLEPEVAVSIIAELPGDLRIEVAERIAVLGRIAPEVFTLVDRMVRDTFERSIRSDDLTRRGGLKHLVEVLNLSNRGIEKEIIESMEQRDPEMAESIKQRMFVFEDIVLLDARAVETVLQEAAERDIVLSLKGVDDRVRNHVFAGCGPEKTERISKSIEGVGPVRLSEVERAQQRVVSKIRSLEGEGRIHVARADETVV